MRDPIVEEIRRVRDEHARRFDYDVDSIFADIRKREKARGLPLLTLSLRPVGRAGRTAGKKNKRSGRAA